ncbi:MAG: hypothetical protein AB4057_08265 [Crocosphaera sp.]
MSQNEERGRKAAVEGIANEHIVVGLLMKRYQNVSLVDLPLSTYDIIIVRKVQEGEDIIRAQVKTSKKSISFTGGTRGGVDRTYKSGVKEYIQSSETSDVIIGIYPSNNSFDLYFVPTILVEKLNQKSISLNKVAMLKNNYEILERCKDRDFVISRCQEYKILPNS